MFEEYRIRRLLKRDITVETYQKLPYKIKKDARVIEKFLSIDKNNINFLFRDQVLEIVQKDYSFCEFLNQDLINSLFSKLDISQMNIDEKIFSLLNASNKHKIFKHDPKLYFNLLSNQELSYKFSNMVHEMREKQDGYFDGKGAITDPEVIKDILLSLPSDKIAFIARHSSLRTEEFIFEVISSLSEQEQMSLYNGDNELFKYLSINIQEDIRILQAEGDIDKILQLSDNAQIKYFLKNIEQLQFAPDKTIGIVFKNMDTSISAELFRKITYDKYYNLRYYFKNIYTSMSYEEMLKILKGGCKNLLEYKEGLFHQPELIKNLREIIKLNLLEISDDNKRKEVLDVFDSKVKSENDLLWNGLGIQLTSMLLDDKIIQNNSPELLKQYSETGDRKLFVEILSNAYGEHVRTILESRPMLRYHEIPNFKIFENSIVESLGTIFVEYILTYDYSRFSYELSSIATVPKKMETFKKIWEHTLSSSETVDAGTIYEIMDSFVKYEELISKLDFSNMTELQKNHFALFLKDAKNVDVVVTSLEDLDNYLAIRHDAFLRKMEQSNGSKDMENIIFEYLTGREVNSKTATIDTMSVKNVVEVFNFDNIVRNPELIQSMGLNDDEIALLLLINQISGINNEQVLKDVFVAISTCKELNPLQFKSTFDKISVYYVEKFKSELTDSENLRQMPQTIVDGVPIVTFDGEPFNMLCSITGLNLTLSQYCDFENKDDLLTSWLNLENGSSTISCTLCCSDINVNPAGIYEVMPEITLVFDTDVEVVGMGGSDISASHVKRQARHGFEYIGHNKMKYGTMPEIKKDMVETMVEMSSTGLDKFPSEVNIKRREEDINSPQALRRRMPIGMYVLGEITEDHIRVAKMFSDYYKKENLGEFMIIKVNPEKYKSTIRYHYAQTNQEPIQSNVAWYQAASEQIGRGK